MKTANSGGAGLRGLPQLLKLDQVADALGVCARTVRRLVEKPNFPRPLRVGHAVRFDAADIAAYIERQKGEGRP